MMTTKEAAQALGISPRRVNALIEAGTLKAQRFGRAWMVDEAAVNERLQNKPGSGRPKDHGRNDTARYTLMNRDHPVFDFTYSARTGEVTDIAPLEGIAWKPFGVGQLRKEPNRFQVAQWLRSRAIPAVRPNLPRALRDLEASTPTALMFASWGLSLSDPYWLRPEGTEASWTDVNYFDNGYEEAFGDLMLGNTAQAGAGATITHSPDTATNGMLAKTWVRRQGTDWLVKGGLGNENREPYNEKLATALLTRLLEPGEFVPYEVVDRRGRAYSSCANMVSEGEELIPAQDVLTAFGVSEGRNLHDGYLRALRELGVDDGRRLVDKMIVVDHLMANFDRHTHNFGLIRNSETIDGYRIAPLFDHGCGFYSRATTAELERGRYLWKSHPFCGYPSQQLALVEDLGWYDPSALEGFDDDIARILGQNPEIDERFIAAVQRQTARQIEAINDLAVERGFIAPVGWPSL